jgi:hypothetical protein
VAKADGTSETTRAVGAEAGARVAKADGTSETTRAVGTEAGARVAKADGTSETTRAVGAEAGARASLAPKQEILAVEVIQVRKEEETEDVEPTRAFFISLILRVLWRRVLR